MESTIKKEPAPSSPYQPTPPLSPSVQNDPYLQQDAESHFQPRASSIEPILAPPYSPTPNVMIIQQPQNRQSSWRNQKIILILVCVIVATVIFIKTIYYVAMQH